MHVPQTEIILKHGGAELARVTLPPGEYVIGRNADVEIFADTPLISRRHAQLTINYDHLLLEDLGSSNGTFVNEKPIAESVRLFPNQPVRLGDVQVEIHWLRAPEDPEVSLAPAQAAIRELVPDEVLAGRRYAIGQQVARGGMGAILQAQQNAMKRRVAMKVMLEASEVGDVTRFVEEAQITGQLEHPNIVPVHELGVDEQGQLFYTMKFVRGITLKKVLELLAQGVPETMQKFTLPALLTIFQKTCDAIAFAHSKGVIHRDLKPENLMLGDFGEVLVMDWGLAKVVGHGGSGNATVPGRSTVMSARTGKGDTSRTLSGTIMGTPAYMAPEQARGEVETLDARADIYSLGAILFEILHLRVPISGSDAWEIVEKVKRGEVEWTPRSGGFQPPRRRRGIEAVGRAGEPRALAKRPSLPPDSLLAVCRKALALDRAERYASVEDFQADLTAYQDGFATRAERASWRKRAALAIKRNKAASAAAVLVLLAGLGFGGNAIVAGHRAERAAARAIAEAKRAELALADLKATAPDLLALAAGEAGLQRYESALKKAEAALALDPSLAAAWWRRGWVLLAQEKLPEALEALHEAADKDPANKRNAALLPLVEKMAAAPVEKRHEFEIIKPLYDHLTAVGAVGEATPLLPHLKLGNDARLALVKERVERWLGKAPSGGKAPFSVTLTSATHHVMVGINGVHVGSLEPLRGLPIDELIVEGGGLTSLEPLRGMRLVVLQANYNAIEDLEPLRGMPLENLRLSENHVKDLSPLAGMPLKALMLAGNGDVFDLHPLAGLPLEELQMSKCPVSDFSALRGMPLRKLNLHATRFSEGRVLAGMPLTELGVSSTPFSDATTLVGLPLKSLDLWSCALNNLSPLLRIPTLESLSTSLPMEKLLPLRAHPGLKQIRAKSGSYRPVAEFWAAYDAQKEAAPAK